MMDNRTPKSGQSVDFFSSSECATNSSNYVDIFTSSINVTTATTTTENNSHADSIFAYPAINSILALSITSLVTLLTILGNLMVLLAYYIEQPLREKNSNYLLVSMAISDLLLGAMSCNQYAIYSVLGYWPFGEIYCHIWFYTSISFAMVTQNNAFVIAIDRFLGIKYPFKYRFWRTNTKVLVIIFLLWAHCLVIVGIAYMFWTINKDPDFNKERPKCGLSMNPVAAMFLLLLSFYIRLIIIAVLYRYLYKVAHIFETKLKQRTQPKETTNLQTSKTSTSVKVEKAEDSNQNLTNDFEAISYDATDEPDESVGHQNRWIVDWDVISGFKFLKNYSLIKSFSSFSGTSVSNSRVNECSDTDSVKKLSGENTPKLVKGASPSETPLGLLQKVHVNTNVIHDGTNIDAKTNTTATTVFGTTTKSKRQSIESTNFKSLRDMDGNEQGMSRVDFSNNSLLASNNAPKLRILVSPAECRQDLETSPGSKYAVDADPELTYGGRQKVSSIDLDTSNCSEDTDGIEQMRDRKQKALRVVAFILIAYVVSYGPFAVYILAEVVLKFDPPDYVFKIFYWMNHLNSCVNPLMYAYANPSFKATFHRILHCDWKRNRSKVYTAKEKKERRAMFH